jgi:hypothetical protein
LERSVRDLARALYPLEVRSWLLIESDSTDKTLEVLESLSMKVEGFNFQSMGKLAKQMPERVRRISYCREVARGQVLKLVSSKSARIVVADFDGPTKSLSKSDLYNSMMRDSEAAVIAANSSSRYYDILALRAKNWIDKDYREIEADLISRGFGKLAAKYSALVKNQKLIRPEWPAIEVDSAFGGLAVYQSAVMSVTSYETTSWECEHVALHKKIRALGGRIIVDPKLQVRPEFRHIWASSPLLGLAWRALLIFEKVAMRVKRKLVG